jgi:hypothetical protein
MCDGIKDDWRVSHLARLYLKTMCFLLRAATVKFASKQAQYEVLE